MRRVIPAGSRGAVRQNAPVDHVKALILERVKSLNAEAEACAAAMGVSLSTWYARLRQPTDQWLLGEVLSVCAFLGIEIEELRTALRYERNRKRERL